MKGDTLMKTPEELSALNEEELAQVAGGNGFTPYNNLPCVQAYGSQKPLAGSCDVAIDVPECAVCPSNPINKPYNPLIG